MARSIREGHGQRTKVAAAGDPERKGKIHNDGPNEYCYCDTKRRPSDRGQERSTVKADYRWTVDRGGVIVLEAEEREGTPHRHERKGS